MQLSLRPAGARERKRVEEQADDVAEDWVLEPVVGCGRGESQCHARRTLITSLNAPPAIPASLVSGGSEYQAIQRILPLTLVTAAFASVASLKATSATSKVLFSHTAT